MKDASELILGMVNFLAPFLPQLQSVMQPLNALLSKKNAWTWDTEQSTPLDTTGLLSSSAVDGSPDQNKSPRDKAKATF
ncbi:hypothetical protein SK128_007047 [Halocaridina rubra]|uniref:Uncharacterized protein n=1 Tax=Halocaridina rubra TaxID=373956 RepID=A0AAN8WYL9_HALRR